MKSCRSMLLLIAVVGVVLLLPGAAGAEGVENIPDSDADGVPDTWDVCGTGTLLDEAVPYEHLNTNRFALVDGDRVFDTEAPKGKGPKRGYSLDGSTGSSTCGCSCEQILALSEGEKEGHLKFGCSIGIMDGFVNTRCEIDGDGDGFMISEGDCDDGDHLRNPGATEACNGVDDDCDSIIPPEESDADGDGYRVCQGDCDDTDPAINPKAPELCDGIDNDCNGQVDEGVKLTFYLDGDGDGYGGLDTVQACGGPDGYVETPGDCDDADPGIHPGATEVCNGVDDDCDDLVPADETDADGDGFRVCEDDCNDDDTDTHPGADELCNGVDDDCDETVPEDETDHDGDGFRPCEGDCNDADPSAYPGAAEACNGLDDDCDGILPVNEADQDNDRVMACAGDCDDSDANINPGFAEVCDEKDNDCDGSVDEGFDSDGDGYTGWYSGCGNDCDDGDTLTHPGAAEACDGKDNDCDGDVDEGVQLGFFQDGDGDGLGGPVTVLACSLPVEASVETGDCDDTNPARSPETTEICDGTDNDCDNQVDEGLPLTTLFEDADRDGFGGTVTLDACSVRDGFVVLPGDCMDTDAGVYPGGEEVCDGMDNNCDGTADEFLQAVFYRDADADGSGGTESLEACSAPAGYVDTSDDCDDTRATAHPGAGEICDDLDNDCDALIDEDLPLQTLYRDADGDGFGSSTMSLVTCSAPLPGYAADSTDCDDTDRFTNTAATEYCDGKDNDCDIQVDEGLLLTFYQDADGDGYGGTVTVQACMATAGSVPNSGDCNDADASVHTGAAEVACDGTDQNCNGPGDEGLGDGDHDGYTECTGDCNDATAAIRPGATDTACDSIDQDCDGKDDCSTRFRIDRGTVLDTETGLYWLRDANCTTMIGRYTKPSWDPNPSLVTKVGLLGHGQCGLADGSGPGNWRIPTVAEMKSLFRREHCQDAVYGLICDPSWCSNPYQWADGCLGNTAGTARWLPGDPFYNPVTLYLNHPPGWDAPYLYFTSDSAGPGKQYTVNLWDATMNYFGGYPPSSRPSELYIHWAYVTESSDTWPQYAWPVRDALVDSDNDGYYRGQDCDDADPTVHPGATEVCDSIDNDCDGRIDEVCDSDGDGYTPEGGDCNDSDAYSHPGAVETCDGKDNDCDGTTDEGVTLTFYRDADTDGYGGSGTTQACAATAGYVANSGDCNDNDAGVNPGAQDPCDGKDGNCDGREEDRQLFFRDQDGDGYGSRPATVACSVPAGYVANWNDCDDTDPAVNPLATEVCDHDDNDCDFQVDEGLRVTYYRDHDRDGTGGSRSITACSAPSGAVTPTGDCNDDDRAAYPGATEYCDGKDNDCDGTTDESEGLVCRFRDQGDGTVLDTNTGLYWLKIANLGGGAVTLGQAEEGVANARDGSYGLSDGSWNGAWRLPTLDEMKGLCGNCGAFCSLSNAGGNGPWREGDAFSGVRNGVNSAVYWTDTPADGGRQRLFEVYGGTCIDMPWLSAEPDFPIYYSFYVWPVREAFLDLDGDTYRDLEGPRVGQDCDDTSPSINPGATEICNIVDDDCDGRVDETCDYDSDGFTPEEGDCKDHDAAINPSKTEVMNGIDDNCDGKVDERFTNKGDGTVVDNVNHIRWLQNPSLIPVSTRQEAVDIVAGLGDGQYGLSDGSQPGDWKLPTVAEFEPLMNRLYAYDDDADCNCEILGLPKIYRKCWLDIPLGPALSNSQGNAAWKEGDPFSQVTLQNNECTGTCQRICQHVYVPPITLPADACMGQPYVCNLNLFWTRETIGAYKMASLEWPPVLGRKCRGCSSVWDFVTLGEWGEWPWEDPGGSCCIAYDINRGKSPEFLPGYYCGQKLKVWPWRPD